MPIDGCHELTQGYHNWHKAIDLATDVGTPLFSIISGVVMQVEELVDMGLSIRIRKEDGEMWHETIYAHLEYVIVEEKQTVKEGQLIGATGNSGKKTTGPHLHFAYFNKHGESPLKNEFPREREGELIC